MDTFVKAAHSGWRYLVLLVLLLALIKYLVGWLGKGRWTNLDVILNRFTPIIVDVQWLLGIILYVMKQSWTYGPKVAYEHPTMMTLGLIVAHITSARVRKADGDSSKFMTGFVGYLLAALLIAWGVLTVVATLWASTMAM